ELVHQAVPLFSSRLQRNASNAANAANTRSAPPLRMPVTYRPYRRSAGSYLKQRNRTRSSEVPTFSPPASTSANLRSRGGVLKPERYREILPLAVTTMITAGWAY